MGVFSRSKTTEVGAQISRVVEDKLVPNTTQRATLQAIMKGHPIGLNIVESHLNGPATNIERFFRFGRDTFVEGLPLTTTFVNELKTDKIKQIIDNETGFDVEIEYQNFGLPNLTHLAWEQLFKNHNYNNESTNKLEMVPINYEPNDFVEGYWLHSIEARYGESVADGRDYNNLKGWGTSSRSGFVPKVRDYRSDYKNRVLPNPYQILSEDSELNTQEARVYFSWTRREGRAQQLGTTTDYFVLDFSDIDDEQEFFQVKYRYTEYDTEKVGYWTYDGISGTYPELDTLFDTASTSNTDNTSQYFPIVLLRSDRNNITTPEFHDTQYYKQSVEMFDMLGLNLQDMSDQLHQEDDINKVEQLGLMFAIPANSGNQIDQKYLFDFFDRAVTNNSGKTAFTYKSKDFLSTLTYDSVSKKTIGGQLSNSKKYENELQEFDYTYYVEQRTAPSADADVNRVERHKTAYKRIYRKQITDSYYEEITVWRPKMTYTIWKTLTDDGSGDSDLLLIPLDNLIVSEYDLGDKEEIYHRAMHWIVNTKVTEKGNFWSRGIVQGVIVVAAVALAAVGVGDLFSNLAGAASLTSMAMIVAEAIVISVLVDLTVDFLVAELGAEVALAIAVVASIYTFSVNNGFASLKGLPFAEEFLFFAANLLPSTNEAIQEEVSNVGKDIKDFNLVKEEKFDELKEVRDSMDTESLLDPLSFTGFFPVQDTAEPPEDFYQRTIHSGNIGTFSIDAIEHYVSSALKLPDIDDSVGGLLNE